MPVAYPLLSLSADAELTTVCMSRALSRRTQLSHWRSWQTPRTHLMNSRTQSFCRLWYEAVTSTFGYP